MAFVSVVGLRPAAAPVSSVSSFVGARVTTAAPARAAVVARLGTVAGNSSLDKLGLDKFSERFEVPSAARPAGFSADYEVIIRGIYRQIFGNAYIMESERAEMAKEESEFRDGRTSVKGFCQALAKSYQYKKRFFDGRPLYGAIELNFKHFLGRTPDGLEQYRAKSAVYDTKGYEAFVDSFFEDGEYDLAFDEWCSPFYRGHLTTSNLSMAAFTHMFQVVRGGSSSDKANVRTMTDKISLNRAGIQSIPLAVIAPGADGSTFQAPDESSGSWQNGFSGATMARNSFGNRAGGEGKMYRIEVTNSAITGKMSKVRNNTRTGKIPFFRAANRVYLVPFSQLSATYVKVHNDGGKIASIVPV